jgi:hypothetical protein
MAIGGILILAAALIGSGTLARLVRRRLGH